MMTLYRLLAALAWLAALLAVAGVSRAEIQAESAANYIHHLFDTSMRADIAPPLFCPQIAPFGRFAAGHAWRSLSPAERHRFAQGFCGLSIDALKRLQANFPGLRLELGHVMPAAQGMAVVSSAVTRPGNPALWPVEWQVAATDDDLRLADIRLLGMSLGIFLRSLANAEPPVGPPSADLILDRWRQALDRVLPPE